MDTDALAKEIVMMRDSLHQITNTPALIHYLPGEAQMLANIESRLGYIWAELAGYSGIFEQAE